ncbi:unnamed protein product [Ectocarpus sp. CCAP 1310/34]|nr:unnamed protein product [Ectocarpus sp. CCAP 1310/34]
MDAIITALSTSVLGTLRVLAILLAGFFASRWPKSEPLLAKETCRAFSRACALLFLPSLMISSLGATLNPEALKNSWQLVVAGSFTVALSGTVAWVVGRVFFRRPEDRRAFRPAGLAITFANSAGFPLLLMNALCEQDYVRSDYNDDALECFTQATGMIFIYVVVWQMYFFGWGFYALGHDDTLERSLTGQQTRTRTPSTKTRAAARATSSTSSARQEHGGVGRINAAEAVVIDIEPCTGEESSSEGTTNAGGTEDGGDVSEGGPWAGFKERVSRVLVSPNIISVTIGVVIAMIAPLQEMLFDNSRSILRPLGAALQTVGTPEVAVSTLVMAGSLAQVPTVAAASTQGGQGDDDGTLRRKRRFRIIAGFLHVVCRLIVVPAIGFTLFWVARTQSSVMGENRLMHLILLIEFAMPSAAFVIVSLNQLRMPATAGFMARLYLWQYGASMLTITAWTALAVHLVY